MNCALHTHTHSAYLSKLSEFMVVVDKSDLMEDRKTGRKGVGERVRMVVIKERGREEV